MGWINENPDEKIVPNKGLVLPKIWVMWELEN